MVFVDILKFVVSWLVEAAPQPEGNSVCAQQAPDPMDCSPPAPLSMVFFQSSILECPSPGDLLNPEVKSESLTSPALAGGFFTTRVFCLISLEFSP